MRLAMMRLELERKGETEKVQTQREEIDSQKKRLPMISKRAKLKKLNGLTFLLGSFWREGWKNVFGL